jgi:hypothetical protein
MNVVVTIIRYSLCIVVGIAPIATIRANRIKEENDSFYPSIGGL